MTNLLKLHSAVPPGNASDLPKSLSSMLKTKNKKVYFRFTYIFHTHDLDLTQQFFSWALIKEVSSWIYFSLYFNSHASPWTFLPLLINDNRKGFFLHTSRNFSESKMDNKKKKLFVVSAFLLKGNFLILTFCTWQETCVFHVKLVWKECSELPLFRYFSRFLFGKINNTLNHKAIW